MTQEQKAKAYDKALEIAKAWCKLDNNDLCNDDLETLFPELKESEEEKIRKWIIDDIRYNMNNEPLNNSEYKKEAEKAIAWLEKQKEFVSADFDDVWDTADCDELTAPLEKYSKDAIKEMCHAWYDKGIELERKSWLEKQGEQKPAGKVDTKFNIGDWVVNKLGDSWHIDSFDKKNYQVSDGKGNYNWFPISKQDEMHLWTVKDAKDGDVLVHNDCTFIFMGIKDGIVQAIEENILEPVSFGKPDEDNDYHPATKEQRALFFKKITEAGYMWDSDSKRLYK